MPGIVGFQGIIGAQAGEALMNALVQALGVEDGYKVDSFTSANLGMGRVHLGLIDKRPQPLWNADHSVALVMTGEIFSWDGLHLERPLTGKEPDFDNAALLLAAYAEYGEACVDHINGTFAAAIWNAPEQTLLLITDHLSSYPLYYAQVGDLLVFGSGARAVAQAPGLPRAANTAAIAELVALEHLYGDKTLFSGVRLLLPGTVLRFHAGNLSQTRYVDYQFPEYYELLSEEHYIEEWKLRARRAIARQARGPAPLGVMLTGGLDSRTILGMLAGNDVEVRTITFGIPDCDDELSARAMAQALHVPHKFIPLPHDYLAHQAARGVRITDGQKSVVHFNMIGAIDRVTEESRTLYKGFLGGTMHGDGVTHDRLAPVREEVWFEHVFQVHNCIFAERDLPEVYTGAMYQQVRDVPRQTVCEAYARSRANSWADKSSYVEMYEEDVRFTVMGVELGRSQALVRTPLADRDLLSLAVSVPPGYRVDKNYYRNAISQALPKLAKVDYSRTQRPVTDGCFRDVRKRTNELTRYWLRNHGMQWVPLRQAHPYADYGRWMRSELRPWVEATLLSPQSLDRGYFQPAYIRKVVGEHMNGCDHTRRLGVLLALELWHQQFID
ncbi:MAG: asparagine synthase-related protein [Caldilineaceae bacterium]